MTKYILNSGNLGEYPEKAVKYYSELFKHCSNKPRVLWCFFATEAERRDDKFKKYTTSFVDSYPNGINPVNVHATPDNFEMEAGIADIISIHGGDSMRLKKNLAQYNLKKLFEGKTIAGHSAGSNNLSKQFWSPGRRKIGEGYGFVPCKFLSHFKSCFGSDDPRGPINWDQAYQKLEAYGDTSLPIYALEEGEFVVIHV